MLYVIHISVKLEQLFQLKIVIHSKLFQKLTSKNISDYYKKWFLSRHTYSTMLFLKTRLCFKSKTLSVLVTESFCSCLTFHWKGCYGLFTVYNLLSVSLFGCFSLHRIWNEKPLEQDHDYRVCCCWAPHAGLQPQFYLMLKRTQRIKSQLIQLLSSEWASPKI